jgi:hypothetical protein
MSPLAKTSSVPPLFAAVTLVLSLFLLLSSLLYAFAAALVLPSLPDLARIEAGQRPETVSADIAAHEQALRLFPDARLLAALALLQVTAARSDPAADWAVPDAALQRSLQQRPLDSLAWARLAYVKVQQGRRAEAAEALSRSLATGRFIPGFMQWRFAQGLGLWDDLDDTVKAGMADQAGLLWRKRKWNLIRLGRVAPFSAPLETLMRDYHPALLDEFLHGRGPLRHTH